MSVKFRHSGFTLLAIGIMSAGLFISCNRNQTNDYLGWAKMTADSFIKRSPDYKITYEQDREKHKWHYEQGLMLNALYALWTATGEGEYYEFIQKNIDLYVEENGLISTYKQHDFKLDDIGPGMTLLRLYNRTGDEKYKKAADLLRQQLENQPRTSTGGFWHKKIYDWQMWLDGLYMAEPFYTEYERELSDSPDYSDIIKQFSLIYSKTLDKQTGLLYHGWDEKCQQIWANPQTGLSPHLWGRGIGWYMMALVDVLEILPQDTPHREILKKQLNALAKAIIDVRDVESNVWYQVLDQGGREGNYLESSASAMFIYSFAKGANLGYLPADYFNESRKSFRGFIENFVSVDDSGMIDVLHACSGAGLGGKQQRDGSYDYYISEPQRTNDFKAVGPFILAALELEKGRTKR